MLKHIELFKEEFLKKSKNKQVQVISHNDTDGITSAAIMTRALSRENLNFSTKIVKGLDEETIMSLPQDKLIVFLDLASNSFEYIKKLKTDIFILDHHEITSEIPENVTIVNPHLYNEEEISGAGIVYLFAKALNEKNKDLAKLAIIGMVGDMLEKNPGKIYREIINDSNVTIKKGLIMYPATRPINKVLEFSSDIFINGVTGSSLGAINFLRDLEITPGSNGYKTIMELNEEEISKLITAITLQRSDEGDPSDLIGNIYLMKHFNRLDDVRQISATINACSRSGESGIAVAYCLENKNSKEKVDKIYTKHRQEIVRSLQMLDKIKKIEDKNYVIINAEDKIKDTIIGTIASIISNSKDYQAGKAIIAMAYNENKIKISARMVGKSEKNVREILNSVVEIIGGEVGGHHAAAGALIEKQKESMFIEELKKQLEVELIKI